MSEVATGFAAAAAVALLGFLAYSLYRRTYIPDALLLIGLGVLLSPATKAIFGCSVVPVESVIGAIPYLAELAVVLVLFERGAELDLTELFRVGGRAVAFTVTNFLVTMISTALFVKIILGLRWAYCLLVGAALATAGSVTVTAVTEKLAISGDAVSIAVTEATLSDVFSLVTCYALIDYLQFGYADPSKIVKVMGSSLLTGLAAGVLFGLGWLYVARSIHREEHGYVATLGTLLALYSVTSWMGGSGALAALAFGLIVGNYYLFRPLLGERGLDSLMLVTTAEMHGEVAFLVRTYFFAVMGLMYVWPTAADIPTVVLAGATTLMAILSRYVSLLPFAKLRPYEGGAIALACGRGIVSALMAQIIFALGLPMADEVYKLVLNVIILTNVVTALGIYVTGKKLARGGEQGSRKGTLAD